MQHSRKRRMGYIIGGIILLLILGIGGISARVPAEIDPTHIPDGIHRGTAFKCPAGLALDVKVDAGRITTIEIGRQISADRYRDACHLLASNIVVHQSVMIDDVTGATVSSRAVKRAVADALRQASPPNAYP